MNNNVVWDIFNRFRGAVDVNTFADLMAYILLLKHSELMSPEYYQDNYSAKYLSRLYGDLITEDDLCHYIEEIERYNHIPVGIISEPFRNTIRKFDAQREKHLLLDVFRAFSEISFENEADIAEAFDYFMKCSVSYMGKMSAGYYSNQSLVKFEAQLLDVREGYEIYDPFCGSGTTAVAAGGDKNPIYVRDKNIDIISIAAINMILHGCNIREVTCGDSLFAEDKKYDRIVSEPPLGVKYPDDIYDQFRIRKDYISRDALEIEKIIDNLNEIGKAVVLVPQGFLFRSGRTQEYRKHLIEDNLVESIISLPAGVLYGAGISTALIVINTNKKKNEILMVDTSTQWSKNNKEFELSEDGITKLSEIVSKQEDVDGISICVKEKDILDNDYNLAPTVYVTPFTVDKIEVKDIKELVNKQKNLEEDLALITQKLNKLREEV